MEVDFMVHPVQLLIKSFARTFLLLLGLVACQGQGDRTVEKKVPSVYTASTDKGLSRPMDVLLYGGEPYSGWVFGLYEKGDTAFVTPFFQGKEQGIARKWYPHKKPMEVRVYDRGYKTGTHAGWWENGKKRFVLKYKNDVFEGHQMEWNQEGRLFKDAHYRQGKEHGTQKYWRPDGTLYANYVVRNGRNYGLTGVMNCKNVGDRIQK